MKKYLYKTKFVRELAQMVKKHLKYINKSYQKYAPPAWQVTDDNCKKIAAICDAFTWKNISLAVHTVYLTPQNWREQLEQEKPEVFFCEATWQGLDREWEGLIFRNYDFEYDNRYVLKDILKYCKKARIKTVFWNKEDSPKFDDKPYSFIDTALLFDHIFTTTVECIQMYQKLGHNSVHLMMFGYSPEIFKVKKPRPQTNTAIFLGSWYDIHKERCKDMCEIFDMLIEQGFNLKIYDRLSKVYQPGRQYPLKYVPYIFPAVPYEQTGDIMNDADYIININTVKNSETMFARRVFEAMACGRIVISNHSVGMEKLFKNAIWYPDKPFNRENEEFIINENLKKISKSYTFEAQLGQAMSEIGINLR